MAKDDDGFYTYQVELYEKEIYFIGSIVAHWGALEHEIFVQTLQTYDPDETAEALPKEMNNIQFTGVLSLWKARVIDTAKRQKKRVLTDQYDAINKLLDHRNALIHGMWNWTEEYPGEVIATRIKKRTIINSRFKPDDLADFSARVQKINFWIRYPAGARDLHKAIVEQGSHVSRRGFDFLFGDAQPPDGGFAVDASPLGKAPPKDEPIS
jgi:hypothetical protein